MEFYFLLLILLLLSGVFATVSATLIWTLDTSSKTATSSSVYTLTSTSTPTFLTTTTNVDVSSADIYVPVGGFLSHGVFYSSTERLEASLGLDHFMLTDDVEVSSCEWKPHERRKHQLLTEFLLHIKHSPTHHHFFHIIRQVAPSMNLTEAPSNLPDLDPEPAPEPPATNNELTLISTFEDETETGTGAEHPANGTEKTSWARCMLTDDVEVSSCERERKRQKQQILTTHSKHPPTKLTSHQCGRTVHI